MGILVGNGVRFLIRRSGKRKGKSTSLFSSRTHLITLKLRGGKGVRGCERDEGLARCGDRWPCRRGDPSQPSQTVQVAGLCEFERVSSLPMPGVDASRESAAWFWRGFVEGK